MDGESNRMWKRSVVTYFEVFSRNSPEGNEENDEKPVRIVDVLAKIRYRHLPNTSQKIYCLSQCAW
jgi:hypothetical protein